MKENKDFTFSVIMAIYNVEKYLEEAIESVINQSISFEKNIQLVLVNDGTPDNSETICMKYKNMYPNNVIYIKQANAGVSSARNRGIEVATGKYLNFLDSDDYFSKNAFSKVKKFFEHYGDQTDVVAINLINFENSEGSWVNGPFFKETRVINMKKEGNFMQCQVGASFIKAEAAKKHLFDTGMKIHEDSHYLYRIFLDRPKCGVISDAIYWHRIRSNGTSATQTIKHKSNIFSITKKLFKELIDMYLKEYDKLPDYLQTFIILELNYYVIKKVKECKFTKEEAEELKHGLDYIFKNIDKDNIVKHFVLNSYDKRRLLDIKKDVNNVFKRENIIKKYYYYTLNGLKRGSRKLVRLTLWTPRRIWGKLLRNTLKRIDSLETNERASSKEITLLRQKIVNLQKEINKLKEKNNL